MIAVVNINYELFDNEEDEPLVECTAYRSYNIVLKVKDKDDLEKKLNKLTAGNSGRKRTKKEQK